MAYCNQLHSGGINSTMVANVGLALENGHWPVHG